MKISLPGKATGKGSLVAGLSAAVALSLGGGAAMAVTATAHPDHADSPAAPRRAASVPDLDSVKDQIRAFYGDHVGADGQHMESQTSTWAREVTKVSDEALGYLQTRVAKGAHKPALVFDIDDTSLSTYQYGANNDFAYKNTAAFGAFLLQGNLPAIPSTLDVAKWAEQHHVAVFYVTGRPDQEGVRGITQGNLSKAGYPDPAGLFLKPTTTNPPYLQCGTNTCTTIEYKSGTRAYIESQGYDILASIGDQLSDLKGGHTDQTFKLPNPTYFTP